MMKMNYYCIFCKEELVFNLKNGQFKCAKCDSNLQIDEGNGINNID